MRPWHCRIPSLIPLLRRRGYSAHAQASGFDDRWRKLSQTERDQVAVEFEPLQRSDWNALTLDQKKMRTRLSARGVT